MTGSLPQEDQLLGFRRATSKQKHNEGDHQARRVRRRHEKKRRAHRNANGKRKERNTISSIFYLRRRGRKLEKKESHRNLKDKSPLGRGRKM